MIGIDIVDLSRIDDTNEAFVRRCLTEKEREELKLRRSPARRKEYIGGRFAAKEAIFKACGARDFLGFSILNREDGRPYVYDHPELDISISHDGGYAVAAAELRKEDQE